MRTRVDTSAARALLLLALLLPLAGGCATSPEPAAPTLGSLVIELEGPGRERLERELSPEFLALFDRLQELVVAREDRAARNVLARARALRPQGRALELADAFDRILLGREAVSAVRLELVTQENASRAGRYRVALFALNEGPRACVLHPGPAVLTLEQTLVDRAGHERRSEASSTADAVTELALPPGEPVVLGLLEFDAPADVGAIAAGTDASASVLAVRYVFDLELLSGDLTVEERSLPAMRLAVAPAERAWIAADLPQELVTPEDFREAVRTGVLDREELLRLAVRVPSERRDEALRGVAGELDRLGLDALAALAPSLRWISGDSRLGDDPTAWRTWIDARLAAGAPEEERGSRLDLPSPEHAR